MNGAQKQRFGVPTATAMNLFGTARRAFRIRFDGLLVIVSFQVPIEDPFRHIASHVVDSVRAGSVGQFGDGHCAGSIGER